MDHLAEIAGNLPVVVRYLLLEDMASPIRSLQDSAASNHEYHHATESDQRVMRKPLLSSLRQIESMRELVPFFSNVSISSYESVYASGGTIDWEAVEKSIMDDMFDGR